MKCKFGKQKEDILPNKRSVAFCRVSIGPNMANLWGNAPYRVWKNLCPPEQMSSGRTRTSEAFARHPSSQALDPIDILLRFFHGHRVTLLQDFVYRYKSLEGLHFIRHHRLPVRRFYQTPSSRW
jgi:hypothetical protein